MTQSNEPNMSVGARNSQQSIFAIHDDLDSYREEDFGEREQFIGLLIGQEEFLLRISAVVEIIMLPQITYVPQAPRFVEGVINLRGTILPTVNIRKMMGLSRAQATSATRVIVVREGDYTAGLIVDGITYVVALLPTEIENQSLSGKNVSAELITGISKRGDKVNGVLDIAKIIVAAGGKASEAGEAPGEEASQVV